jgi:rSAM/selenodomain-associated transferase 2
VIVVSARGEDEPLAPLAASYPQHTWIEAPRGRARQMNAGAAIARGDWLVFLHADTRLPPRWRDALADAERQRCAIGCFAFALDSRRLAARAIELGVALRVLVFRLPYGDQALFVRRDHFERLGGYADLPIMEDVDLVRRARSLGGLFASPLRAVTSARAWEQDGWVRRTARHLRLIVWYFAGVPPERLK